MSRCFRAEADESRVEGLLYRVHQFTKVNFYKLEPRISEFCMHCSYLPYLINFDFIIHIWKFSCVDVKRHTDCFVASPRWGGGGGGVGYLRCTWMISTLAGGWDSYLDGRGYLPWLGGTYLGQGVPTLAGGNDLGLVMVSTSPGGGTPPLDLARVGYPPPGLNRLKTLPSPSFSMQSVMNGSRVLYSLNYKRCIDDFTAMLCVQRLFVSVCTHSGNSEHLWY